MVASWLVDNQTIDRFMDRGGMKVANRAILIITHGEFGIGLMKSIEMIMGPQKNVNALGLKPGQSVDDLRIQVREVVAHNEEQNLETVVLVDLLGGSPSNVALSLLRDYAVNILTGVNMPMLVQILQFYNTEEDTDKLIADVKKTAAEGIHLLNKEFLKSC